MAPLGKFHRLFVASVIVTGACAAFTAERALEARSAEGRFQGLKEAVVAVRTTDVTEAQFSDTIADGLSQYEQRDVGLLALCGLVPLTAVAWILRRRERIDRAIADTQ